MVRTLFEIDKELHDILNIIEYDHDGEISDELSEQLDALIADREGKYQNMGGYMLDLEGDILKFKMVRDKYIQRVKTLENHYKNLKKYMQVHMEYRNLDQIESGDFKFLRRKSAPVVEIRPGCETFIDDNYKTIKLNIPLTDCPPELQEPSKIEVSKSAVAAELKRCIAAIAATGKTPADLSPAEIRDILTRDGLDANIYEQAYIRDNYYVTLK